MLDQEQQSSSAKERVELLNRIGIQLSMVAEGSDARLNNILKHLREALRKGSDDPKKLNQTAEVLFKYLMLEEKDDSSSSAVGSTLANAIKTLLDAISLPAKPKSQLNSLCRKLEKADDISGALSLIKEIVAVVREAAPSATEAADQGSSLKRLFGKKGNDSEAVQQLETFVAGFKELLAELLDHMEVLNEDAARVVELKDQLWSADQIGELEAVLQEVLEMLSALTTEVKAERKQTEKFLSQLRERLGSVEGDITDTMSAEVNALQRAEALGSEVGAEIGDIAEAVREDNDLQHLKESVGGHLQVISKQLVDHIQEEKKLHDETKEKVKMLTRKVREMENQTDELKLQVHKKQQQAMKDALTGVYNRAAYEDRVSEEISRANRNGTPLSLVVIDCDKFKYINDNFGHKAGDIVLRKVAEVMKSRARASDFLARYGGDEFIMLLPDTDQEGARTFTEDVRQKVANAGFNDGGKPLEVTISSGLTTLRETDSAGSLFERADQAMYQAKKAGRNDIGVL